MAQELIKIETGDSVAVTSPYNTDFVAAAKRLGGKWRGGAWHFNPVDERRVRDLCRSVYGTDGNGEADTCTVQVLIGDASEYGQPIVYHGRVIARAFGRDSGAKLGEGIVQLKGKIGSGGSVKNWTTTCSGLEVLIHNFPRAKAQALGLKIEEPTTIDVEALSAERARLQARIAEIDAILAGNK